MASGASVAAPSSTSVLPVTSAPEYRIGLSDVLRVDVWKEPELTATVSVRRDGKISIPLLNDVAAVGQTPMELAAYLSEKLKKFVEDPRVTVVVAQTNPPRIYLVGEVMHHGPMTLLPDMTIFQALATAGLTQFANTKKIYVLRTADNSERKLFVNYKKLIKGQGMNQNIKLEPGDTVVVP
jgi:polysaccharide export outer membrane protein